MTDLNTPYLGIKDAKGYQVLPEKGDLKPTGSKFATWERANLERLAEKLEQELLETQMDLQFALSNWRKAVTRSDR